MGLARKGENGISVAVVTFPPPRENHSRKRTRSPLARHKWLAGWQVMARLVDARAPLLPLGHRAGLIFCNAYGDWRRAMVLMEDMRVAKRRPSGEATALAFCACIRPCPSVCLPHRHRAV